MSDSINDFQADSFAFVKRDSDSFDETRPVWGRAGSPTCNALRINYIIDCPLSRDLLVGESTISRLFVVKIMCFLALCCDVKYRRSFFKIRKLISKALPIVVIRFYLLL